ncbi:MAG: GNAT family N-acetyltransferase [Bacteroidales bacterium]|nr:GNAT family N-acetyltransferase [Bacteroidales bacterium]
METKPIIRNATIFDAPFIARVVLAGIDMLEIEAELPEEQQLIFNQLVDICRMDDTLYSYRNTRIAEVGGQIVGALIGYDGGRYATMREKTFGIVAKQSGMNLSQNAMETGDGEFYLDSMAILPEFRGREIGKQLMLDRMEWARNNGFASVTLLVDKSKPRLRKYYESLGFGFREALFVFGAWYDKLVCLISNV